MQHSTAPVLFESSGDYEVIVDPINEDWVSLLALLDDNRLDEPARRYYLALYHFRKQRARPDLPGRTEIFASSRQQAFEQMLEQMEQRRASHKKAGSALGPEEVFVEPLPKHLGESLPASLSNFSITPPPTSELLGGPGRPPSDAKCLIRAYLAAPLLDVGDDPTSVFRLLHNNSGFARRCGFIGRKANKQSFELTSRRLPSLSVCEEFTEVMTRYGLWYQQRLEQVRHNLEAGVVEMEKSLSFDTSHVEANSHCGNVVPPGTKVEEGKKPKHRKVPRVCKRCDCGEANWPTCIHAWVPTDQGAAVVVKGPTRVYWAHKSSFAALSTSEIPIDVRVCLYAAENDGKTLIPHLTLLNMTIPELVEKLGFALADDSYQGNEKEVARFGQQARLILPVHPRKVRSGLKDEFAGIDHFTPVGFPICNGGHRFVLRGRDIGGERYIWAAPDDEQGRPVCDGCPHRQGCLNRGARRHIRVHRKDLPQLNWEHPQLLARDHARYQKRTGVERAIKRLKVDLNGENLTHRDALRVQAHLDRKLLTLHLLLEIAGSP